jgi:predicted SnoaL-like aldol condensation-catalyzing enzyme
MERTEHKPSESTPDLFGQIARIFSTGDTARAADIFDTHYLDHQRPADSEGVGPEEFIEIVRGARNSLPSLTVSLLGKVLSYEDLHVGLLRWTSPHLRLQRDTVEVLRVANGKVVEHWGMQLRSGQLGDAVEYS